MANKAQRNLIFERLGYKPSDEQAKVHDSEARVRLVGGGERGGKSKLSSNDYLGQFWENPLTWLVAADYERTEPEFMYICEGFDKLGVVFEATKNVNPGEIIVPSLGLNIVTKSAKDPRKLAATAPDLVIGCEASQLSYEDFLRIRGRIAEKRGKMLLAGSFESSLGWYPQFWEMGKAPNDFGLVSFSVPTWSNLAVFPGGKQDPEIKMLEAAMTPEWFLERFGGVPCPPKGMVFNEFRVVIHAGTGGQYELQPSDEIYIFVDPGYSTAYSVLACRLDGEDIWVVDEIYERNLVTSDIIKVARQRPWWKQVVGGAIDIAGTQHQAMAAPAEIWVKEGGVTLRSRKVPIKDSIEAVKRYLVVSPITNQPLLHINSSCTGLISEMGGCPNPFDGQTKVYSWKQDKEGNVVGDVPEDKHNHACKALAYGMVTICGFTPGRLNKKMTTKFF